MKAVDFVERWCDNNITTSVYDAIFIVLAEWVQDIYRDGSVNVYVF